MSLHEVVSLFDRDPEVSAALLTARPDRIRELDFSITEGARVPLLADLLGERPRALLAICATGRESEQVVEALNAYLPTATIVPFPSWETLPHERLSPSAETVGARLAALARLREWRESAAPEGHFVLVASVRAALQPVIEGLDDIEPLSLAVGTRGYNLESLAATLVERAYTRVDLVTRRGEFAVRGGILDVFPPGAEHPARLEFFGDELDEARWFSVADQRSLPGSVDGAIVLPPARELLLTESVRRRAADLIGEAGTLDGMLAKIAEGIAVEGMESLTPALVERLVPLTEMLPADGAVAVVSPERVATRAVHLMETNREFLDAAWASATAGADAPVELAASMRERLGSGEFLTVRELRATAGERSWWTLSAFDSGVAEVSAGDTSDLDASEPVAIRIPVEPIPGFAGRADDAVDHTAALLADGWRVVISAVGQGLRERAGELLAERNHAARPVDELPKELEPGVAYVVRAGIEAGFALPASRIAVLSEADFFGRSAGFSARSPKKLASRRRSVVDPLQLAPGDHVVHQTHGIGRFVELSQREISTGGRNAVKSTREFVVIEYAPSRRGGQPDRLYVPTDQLDLLSRYVGAEAPSLSKMGGSDWAAAKGKARKAVRDIAVELIKLYSARMSSTGYAFAADTPWQRELEDAFAYAETPDQLTTIDEVKADMEKPIPMDRLLSGDVGYGKTEVAVRAAFKAVQDGKQVAVVVPTTLLVKQHFETFAERYAGFPVNLRPLSRFQTDKEAAETLAGLADGSVDVVIGTHRLLSSSVRFKDLGLVIVDEEQRFGVEHKDALKKLKTNVDMLAMTATPIPRTLEMAVTGIREMSTLATPPEDRHPILTYVGPASDKQIQAAIRRELLREGQVFFVHNRVSSINRTAAHLAELVPEARIAVAHGKLSESQLEQIMVDFWERRFDVLVATTIIETGLDVPNANTLIIDRADKYGLSQLHQLRGRVGRGRDRAYAYFLYDGDGTLTETAHERLSTIAANNELGAGIQIAMKDLELRGAGNLLGAEQSGHINGVGFDLYLRMIGEAVATFRGDEKPQAEELRFELPIEARIPESYIGSERLRLEAYQKLSAAASHTDDAAVDRVVDELTDRYGPLPEAVADLVQITRLRRRAASAGLREVAIMGDRLRLSPAVLPDSMQVRLARLYPGSRYVPAQSVVMIPAPSPAPPEGVIEWTAAVLTALFPGSVSLPPPESAE